MNHLVTRICILLTFVIVINCRTVKYAKKVPIGKIESSTLEIGKEAESKQLLLTASGKETNTPNFLRLVVMRLVYGLASSMGIEERLENAFNGVFVPPNADEGVFNLGVLGGGDDGDGIFGGGGDDDGIFGGVGDLFDY